MNKMILIVISLAILAIITGAFVLFNVQTSENQISDNSQSDQSNLVIPQENQEEMSQTEEIPPEPLVSIKEFTVEADDSGLYPSAIEVNKGDTVKITFEVRSQGTYFGGLDFRSGVWGNTGKVSKGESTTVEFIAEETFQFKSYWPASSKLKATGIVTVI